MAVSIVEPRSVTKTETIQDLVDRLGGIPLSRILARPAPGTATEEDLEAACNGKSHVCELVEGTLVEKAMGFRESLLAGALIGLLRAFVVPRKLGRVTGEAGTIKLALGLVRIPDVAFFSRSRLPGGRVPEQPVPQLVPELAIEILSAGNTAPEMEKKRSEYFNAGVDVVWEVDPAKRTVAVYHRGEAQPVIYDHTGTIECGGSLVGFSLDIAGLFGELDETL